MNGFEFISTRSVEDAGELLANGKSTQIIAGGTDLLGEIKQGTTRPERLVSLQGVDDLRGVKIYDEGAIIGSMTTLGEVADSDVIRRRYRALSEACDSVATPQIRNVGTLGGNLCQRPRCWYYRSPHFDCRKKGGDDCFALEGASKFHAVFDTDVCPSVHPSDTAVALIALDARVLLISTDGARMLPVEDFYISPSADATRETVMERGEILAEIVIPTVSPNSRSVFVKAKERQAMDFALASVAMSLGVVGDTVLDARVILGGVAPMPFRARAVEQALAGSSSGEIDTVRVGQLAVEGARPLADNAYKVRLASGLVSRALRVLLKDNTGAGA